MSSYETRAATGGQSAPPSGLDAPDRPLVVMNLAAHPDDDPEDLHRGRRRLKESHTSHWDLDYMSREEMEKLAEASRQARDKEHRD